MTFEEFFRDFWWLMFPIFGMFLAAMGMFQDDAKSTKAMDLIRTYVNQGKDPPPELLQLVAQETDGAHGGTPSSHSRAWSFIVFAALAAGLGTGYYFVRAEDWSFAFLIGAVATGVMALGALFILVFGRKS
ncbi:MAG TPA: hypothetical protein VEF55_01930 [Candidatus Binatia bacterium]|nr:hypothetical protein [Candidatus Binatia bacterium]